jgi:hypothetical protein
MSKEVLIIRCDKVIVEDGRNVLKIYKEFGKNKLFNSNFNDMFACDIEYESLEIYRFKYADSEKEIYFTIDNNELHLIINFYMNKLASLKKDKKIYKVITENVTKDLNSIKNMGFLNRLLFLISGKLRY